MVVRVAGGNGDGGCRRAEGSGCVSSGVGTVGRMLIFEVMDLYSQWLLLNAVWHKS